MILTCAGAVAHRRAGVVATVGSLTHKRCRQDRLGLSAAAKLRGAGDVERPHLVGREASIVHELSGSAPSLLQINTL